jgi:hypothetical protein
MKPENEAQDMKMAASSWLNWPPSFQFMEEVAQERIAPVISVLSAQDARDNQTAQPDVAIVPGREVEIRPESKQTSRSSQPEDPTVVEALHEVAGLLAEAYLRYQKIQRMPANPPADSVNRELAMCHEQRVHGGGQLS